MDGLFLCLILKVFNIIADKYYILFSKSGFTKELKDLAINSDNVELVDLNKLFMVE